MSTGRIGAMANTGIAPLDATTDIGRVRLDLGDSEATNIVDGVGVYGYFSDEAVGNALYLSRGSVTRACGRLIAQLANQLTLAGQSIQASDFRINTLGKGADLFQVAVWYDEKADKEDAIEAREDAEGIAIVTGKLKKHPEPRYFRDELFGVRPLFGSFQAFLP